MKKITSLLLTAAIAASSFCGMMASAAGEVKIRVQAENFTKFYRAVTQEELQLKDLKAKADASINTDAPEKETSGTGGNEKEPKIRSIRPFKDDQVTYTVNIETAGKYDITLNAGVKSLAKDWCDKRMSPYFIVNGNNAFSRPGVVLPAHESKIWGLIATSMGTIDLVEGENTIVIGLDGANQWGNQPVLMDWFELTLVEAAAPAEPTQAPAEPTAAPAEPTQAPKATEAPAVSAAAPVYVIKSADGMDEMSTVADGKAAKEKMVASNGAAVAFMQKDGSNYVPFRYLFEKFGMVDITETFENQADAATAEKAVFDAAITDGKIGAYAWRLEGDKIVIRMVAGSVDVTLTEGQAIVGLINDDGSALELPVTVKDGSTYLPIRAVQLLGYAISYDASTELIYITVAGDGAAAAVDAAKAIVK